MGSVKATEKSPAQRTADEASDAAVESGIRGKWLYPNGSRFIAADMPGVTKSIEKASRQGEPVVLCFPDGQTHLIKPPWLRGLVYRTRLRFRRNIYITD